MRSCAISSSLIMSFPISFISAALRFVIAVSLECGAFVPLHLTTQLLCCFGADVRGPAGSLVEARRDEVVARLGDCDSRLDDRRCGRCRLLQLANAGGHV